MLNKKVHFFSLNRFYFLGKTINRKWAGIIPISKEDHGKSAFKEAFELLQKNEIIGIFPKLFSNEHDKNPRAKTPANSPIPMIMIVWCMRHLRYMGNMLARIFHENFLKGFIIH